MSEKPYRKYGASKGLPDFIKKRRKKVTEEKKEETKESGKKYDGGSIPKLSKAAQREVEKEASETK